MAAPSPDKVKVAIYTPTYNRSAGIRYRVDMMSKALSRRFIVKILADERESMLRRLYRSIGPSLLQKEWIWERMGRSIASKIMKLRPDAAILITDVSGSAIPFLKSSGVKAFLSIEDSTPEWLGMENSVHFNSIFYRYAEKADGIVSVSSGLREKLLPMGIKSEVVPPGLERILIDCDEAIERIKQPIPVLHSGQIYSRQEYEALKSAASSIIRSHGLISYSGGTYGRQLRESLLGAEWYSYPTLDEAAAALKGLAIGLIVRFKAHNPTRLYFHASMLQPILAIGDGWTELVSKNGIGLNIQPAEASEGVSRLLDDYPRYVHSLEKFAESNLLEAAYGPLIRGLEG